MIDSAQKQITAFSSTLLNMDQLGAEKIVRWSIYSCPHPALNEVVNRRWQ